MMGKINKIPIIISVSLLIIGILHLPYGYYTFLRLVICLTAIYIAYNTKKLNKEGWMWAMIFIGLLYNPIKPIVLTKQLWNLLNIISATSFLTFFILNEQYYKKISKKILKRVALVVCILVALTVIVPKIYTYFKLSHIMYRELKEIPACIVIEIKEDKLLLVRYGKIVKAYQVLTGKESTPKGEFKIINKLSNPTWFKDGKVFLPGSAENILGSRWMGLDITGFGIAGGYEVNIKKDKTNGTISMLNEDLEELYEIVPLGMKVIIK